MVKFFKTPFANNGDKLNIPEELQEDGSISFDQGYGEDYEKNRKTDPDAKNISRQSFNGLLYDITDAIGDIQRSGVAKWSDKVTYNKGSLVWHNKSLYSSLLDSNKSQPPSASWTTLLTKESLDLSEYRKKDDLSYEDGRLLTNKEIINNWDQASDENVFSAGFVKGGLGYVTPQMFGALGNGIDNESPSFQMALDYLENKGGGTLYIPSGTYNLSKGYRHPDVCVIVPSNVRVIGDGMGITNIRRTPSERSETGVLFVTKYWDTAFVYDGAKNQIYSDFSIQDGDPNNYKTSGGGLLAFGHASNILVERVEGIDFDQHLTDICGCENVVVRNCVVKNKVMNTGAAPFQVDVAGQGIGILGLNKDNTSNRNVFILDNIIYESHASRIIHFHHSQEFKNVHIKRNFIVMSDKVNQYAIADDGKNYKHDASDLYIEDNTIVMNGTGKGIFFNGQPGTSILNFHVLRNNLYGNGSHGILIGGNNLYNAELFVNNNSVNVKNPTATNGRFGGIVLQSSNVIAANNNDVSVECNNTSRRGQDGNGGITTKYSYKTCINNNNVKVVNEATGSAFYGIRTDNSNGLFINGNNIEAENASYGISYRHDNLKSVKGIISNNTTNGQFHVANYADGNNICNGTNDLEVFDFGVNGTAETSKLLLIEKGSSYEFNLLKTRSNSIGDLAGSYSSSIVIHQPTGSLNGLNNINHGLINTGSGYSGISLMINTNNKLILNTGSDGAGSYINSYSNLVTLDSVRVQVTIGI